MSPTLLARVVVVFRACVRVRACVGVYVVLITRTFACIVFCYYLSIFDECYLLLRVISFLCGAFSCGVAYPVLPLEIITVLLIKRLIHVVNITHKWNVI